jgi:hypothetical protein
MTIEREFLRELEAALNVSPSSNFEAQVRERVRTQSMRARSWTWTVGTAVAASLLLAVMLVPEPHAPPRGPSAHVPGPSTVDASAVSVPLRDPQPFDASRQATSGAQVRFRAARSTEGRSVDIVVPSGQMAAIQRLAAAVSSGRVIRGPDRTAPPGGLQLTALEAASPIEFDTIRFTPLSPEDSPDLWR